MTKKDFELIADTLRISHDACSPDGQLGVAATALFLARELRSTNQAFKDVLFVQRAIPQHTLLRLPNAAWAVTS